VFQFLIGRLKTRGRNPRREACLKFQFLIGRLKTDKAAAALNDLKPFQFLIGRLKTFKEYPICIFFISVSIPHRQAKNKN